MKRTLLLIIFAATWVRCMAEQQHELKDINTINITFQPPQEIFITTNVTRHTVTNAEAICFQKYELQLNATYLIDSQKVWCHRVSTNVYTDYFTENKTTTEELRQLGGASLNVLTNLLGEPVYMEGSIDTLGTVIWKWRICNGKQPNQFKTIEVIVGLNPKRGNDILFLLMRTGYVKSI